MPRAESAESREGTFALVMLLVNLFRSLHVQMSVSVRQMDGSAISKFPVPDNIKARNIIPSLAPAPQKSAPCV